MADAKVRIPRKRSGAHNPQGGKPRRVKDPAALSELEREEREFRDRRSAERKNSKPVRVLVRGPVYIDLLRLSEKYGREPKIQAELCLELGVRFYENDVTPYGGPRPLEHLPEVVEGTVVDPIEPPLHRAPQMHKNLTRGWMGEDQGLPQTPRRPWSATEEPAVAVAPPVEDAPAEPKTETEQPAVEEEIEVSVG